MTPGQNILFYFFFALIWIGLGAVIMITLVEHEVLHMTPWQNILFYFFSTLVGFGLCAVIMITLVDSMWELAKEKEIELRAMKDAYISEKNLAGRRLQQFFFEQARANTLEKQLKEAMVKRDEDGRYAKKV